ncbi:class I SAM-dependent methyltransferase [Geomobilimonas luticola]|uniref:Methyltransferase domain-containing protein n=1 Tax=Geomobilimonas luticola TaxID=1114878 RepID=A0ABS5SG09_9BACT|nr:class I SAM-dependent methyltransferase [Geomobilimonas luticola]MBT0654308.1 methyltransferase domain-containing protein [Geomobilimonas luticola]
MESDRIKWDDRYAGEGLAMGEAPSRFLAERVGEILSLCPGRTAFDIACGEGRNSIFLARHGFRVTGVDISPVGLAKGRERATAESLVVDFLQADLETYRFTATYDLIVNINFLLRELIPPAVAALNPGGLFLFESILDTPTLQGYHTKRFLLQPGELRQLFEGFEGEILQCEELPDAEVPVARLIFRKIKAGNIATTL